MTGRVLLILAGLLLGTGQAEALPGDQRIETVNWQAGKTIELRTTPGSTLVIVFAPGERVLSADLSDPAAFEVTLAPAGDSLTVKTLRTSTDPTLKVRSHLRSYSFTIQVGAPEAAMYAVGFTFDQELPAQSAPPSAASPPTGRASYRLSGAQPLKPSRIEDDGVHTYIEWDGDVPLPAVFALSSLGEEEMVDGYMRGGIFTIDRVNPVLVFRIGKKSAKAVRRSD